MDTDATTAADSRPQWGRPDALNLFIWWAIAFVPAGIMILVAGNPMDSGSSGWVMYKVLAAEVVAGGSMIVAIVVMSIRQKKPLGTFGLPVNQAFGWRFWLGAVVAFAMLSLLELTLGLTGHFQITSQALKGDTAAYYALGWGLTFVFLAFNEELAFRGYLLYVFARRIRFWPTALALSVGFAAAHLPNKGEDAIGILHVFVVGLVLCFSLWRTGSLWFALGFHSAWDWAETYFYGTPDSGQTAQGHLLNSAVKGAGWLTGGTAGPEGSILSIAGLLLVALLIHIVFPKAIYPDRPGT